MNVEKVKDKECGADYAIKKSFNLLLKHTSLDVTVVKLSEAPSSCGTEQFYVQ